MERGFFRKLLSIFMMVYLYMEREKICQPHIFWTFLCTSTHSSWHSKRQHKHSKNILENRNILIIYQRLVKCKTFWIKECCQAQFQLQITDTRVQHYDQIMRLVWFSSEHTRTLIKIKWVFQKSTTNQLIKKTWFVKHG